MSKQPSKIRWRESDLDELQRTIKNYNAKIAYHSKKSPDNAEYLPSKITKKEALEKIETRSEFNRFVNSLQRFSRKGAEEIIKSERGANMTKWAHQEYKLGERLDNARKARELKKLEEQEVTSRGKGTGVKRAQMGTIKENSLKPRHRDPLKMSQKEWDLARSNMDRMLYASYRREKQKRMKENYIKGLIISGFPEDVIEMVRNTPLDDFLEKVINDTEASFDFIYDPIELQVKAQALKRVWSNAING